MNDHDLVILAPDLQVERQMQESARMLRRHKIPDRLNVNVPDAPMGFCTFQQEVLDQPVLKGFVQAKPFRYADPDLRAG